MDFSNETKTSIELIENISQTIGRGLYDVNISYISTLGINHEPERIIILRTINDNDNENTNTLYYNLIFNKENKNVFKYDRKIHVTKSFYEWLLNEELNPHTNNNNNDIKKCELFPTNEVVKQSNPHPRAVIGLINNKVYGGWSILSGSTMNFLITKNQILDNPKKPKKKYNIKIEIINPMKYYVPYQTNNTIIEFIE